MGRSDLTLRGLVPVQFTKQQHPYHPRHHRAWLEVLLAHSDTTAKRAGLRAAILQARKERAHRIRIRPMPQIFEVAPDGTVTEVADAEGPSEVFRNVKTGFLLGALAALPFVLPLAARSILPTNPRKERRRRGR